MSDDKKTFVGKIGEIASLKEIIYGVLVISGFVGGLYGSFKPEVIAEKNHEELKPVVTQVTEMSNEHREIIEEQARELDETKAKLNVLEQKFEILELVNMSLINQEATIDLEDLYKLFSRRRRRETARLKKVNVNPSPDISFDIQ